MFLKYLTRDFCIVFLTQNIFLERYCNVTTETESWKVTLPSFRFPMTACFFRKSLQSFLLSPKATMLWVNVLDKQKQLFMSLWTYKTTPENMQWTLFLSILCKIRAMPCDSPQLTKSNVLIKSGAIFFLFLGHMTPLFSEGTKTRGQGQKSLILLSSSMRDHQRPSTQYL